MSDIWKPVLGFEGLYEVSSNGLVRRLAGPYRRETRPIKHYFDRRGYCRTKLSRGGIVSMHNIHKLVAEAFIGPMPKNATVNHKNTIKTDNNYLNLEYCSRLENTIHAVANGRISLSGATLSEDAVRQIRDRYIPRNNVALLAEEFGITKRTVHRIVSGQFWKHVT
jgi:hypothetical protein